MSIPEQDDPLAGTPYRVRDRLGAGGMGEVFEAEHRKLGRRVVVKILHRHLAHRSILADRMRLEGQALARVTHPNVVAALDLGAAPDDRPYLVMERLHGRTLRAELSARGPLPPAEAALLVAQALDGLSAVHAAGLCHRDLKLDNLFLCDAPPGGAQVVKVLDLGVAKVVDASGPAPLAVPTEEGVSMGTPRFFSPEQATGTRVDPRSDVYAMGVVLYMLCAGRGPFDHLTRLTAVLDAHAAEEPAPPSQFTPIPPALDRVILRALAKDPAARFPTAAAFASALRDVAADLTRSPLRRLGWLFVRVLVASLALSIVATAVARWALG